MTFARSVGLFSPAKPMAVPGMKSLGEVRNWSRLSKVQVMPSWPFASIAAEYLKPVVMDDGRTDDAVEVGTDLGGFALAERVAGEAGLGLGLAGLGVGRLQPDRDRSDHLAPPAAAPPAAASPPCAGSATATS